MFGHYPILGGLSLGLIARVSAKPLNINGTTLGPITNVSVTDVITANIVDSDEIINITVLPESGPIAENAAAPLAGSQLSSLMTTTVQLAVASTTSFADQYTSTVTDTAPQCALGSVSGSPATSSAMIAGQAPFATAASSSVPVAYAASTLLPAVHWDYPTNDLQNLAPANGSNLYYSSGGVSDPTVQHLFGALSSTFQYDAVVLDHSSYVANTSCSSDGILVTFTSTDAYNFASSSWAAASSGFVLVTYTDGCHGASNQQRTFWLIKSLEFSPNSLSIIAEVETEVAIENALSNVDFQWGTYYPPKGNSTASSSSTTSSIAGAQTSSSGRPSPSSSSRGSTSGAVCGNAPSSIIDGLPAANCGDADFDMELDTAIGFLQFDSESSDAASFEEFLPGDVLNATQLADLQDSRTLSRRTSLLGKRSLWDDISDGASSVFDTAVDAGAQAIQAAKDLANEAAAKAAQLAKDLTELDPSISASTDFNFGPDANADSPWGKAAQVYATSASTQSGAGSADVTIYCVDCGIKGHVALAGQVKFNIVDGLHSLNANINANLEAGVNIGLVANAQYSNTNTRRLVEQALPEVGVSVDSIFSVGVFLTVDAVSTVDVSATGQAIVGVTMTIPDFEAKLDLFDQNSAGGSGVTGIEPIFNKRFEATGKIAASVQLALPIEFNCGFEIPALSLKRAISLIERPSLYGKLTVAASTSNVDPASETCNNGIEYFANVQNDLKFDFLGLQTFDLNHYESPPLLQGCQHFTSNDIAKNDLSLSAPAIKGLYANATGKTVTPNLDQPGSTSRRYAFVRRDNTTSTTNDNGDVIDDEPQNDFHNTDTSDETTGTVTDDSTDADGTEYQESASQALELAADAKAQDGIIFTTLIDSQKTFQIAPAQDGPTSDAGLFATAKNLIFGDDQDRVLLFYPEEIGAYNASRIRLAPVSAVPKTAQIITLSQLPGASASSSTYFAFSLEKEIYNLVLCNFDNGAASKVFLVSGQSGLDSLQKNPDIKYTITGAPVSSCAPLSLANGGNGVV
ncbi:hypothetical protein M436DRAFT_86559 [Aureobasidium namibiae CBS 147.97]|uniref:Uncharacterized protein n=1 Tax=Aureobasidium namibiae CBS 147.97 TaxID=1043004 RepID=A0A074WEK1_9PEZI